MIKRTYFWIKSNFVTKILTRKLFCGFFPPCKKINNPLTRFTSFYPFLNHRPIPIPKTIFLIGKTNILAESTNILANIDPKTVYRSYPVPKHLCLIFILNSFWTAGLEKHGRSKHASFFRFHCRYEMIAIFFLEFLTDLITLSQSFWLSNERPTNLLNQNNGLSNKWWHDWLMSPQIFKYSTSKFQKIFSARCWKPGLLMIFSILDTNLNLTLILVQLTSEYLQWNWQGWTATACHDWLTLHIKS